MATMRIFEVISDKCNIKFVKSNKFLPNINDDDDNNEIIIIIIIDHNNSSLFTVARNNTENVIRVEFDCITSPHPVS